MHITVVGMHRSGTSLTAKIVNIAGAYLGEDTAMLAADSANEKGYWENVTFLDLNNRLLAHFGGSSYAPPRLPADWNSDPTVARWREEARAFVASEFGEHEIWAWKEPRTSLLLPVWRSIVPDLKYVICVRNPLDVIASMTKRDGFTLKHVAAMWHLYTLRALVDSDFDAATIVFYEELLKDPRSAAKSFLRPLDLERSMDEDKWRRIESFVDRGLEHHHHSLQDLLDHPEITTATKQLYSRLVNGEAKAVRTEAERDPGQVLEWIYDYSAECARAYDNREIQRQRDRAEAKARQLEAVLNTKSHRLASMIGQLRRGNRDRR